MILARWRIPENVVGDPAVSDLVRALLHFHRRDRGHWRDSRNIDFRQLLYEGQDSVEFGLEVVDLLLGDGNARKMRDMADGSDVDGHFRSYFRLTRNRVDPADLTRLD